MTCSADLALEATRLLSAGEHYEALRCLNEATPHRFTALYRREGDRAWNALLYDKQSPYTPQFPEVAASATYCSMAIEGNTVIVVENSLTDPRLTDHAARDAVRSYCGAPVADAAGTPIGTLCHFDFAPLATPVGVEALMERLARQMSDATVTDALQGDVARRLDRLACDVRASAAANSPADDDATFAEWSAPVRALMPRLSMSARSQVEERLGRLRGDIGVAARQAHG